MDLTKALGIMGIGSARKVDASGDRDAQDELNENLTRLMDVHEKKKKKILETEKVESRAEHAQNKLRDEIRTIHEGYQFLAKKYKYDKQRREQLQQEKQLLQKEENALIVIEDEETTDVVFGLKETMDAKTALNKWKKGKIEDVNEHKEIISSSEDDGEVVSIKVDSD